MTNDEALMSNNDERPNVPPLSSSSSFAFPVSLALSHSSFREAVAGPSNVHH